MVLSISNKSSQYTDFPARERTKDKGDFHGNTNIV